MLHIVKLVLSETDEQRDDDKMIQKSATAMKAGKTTFSFTFARIQNCFLHITQMNDYV